jgi:hypothetical protein
MDGLTKRGVAKTLFGISTIQYIQENAYSVVSRTYFVTSLVMRIPSAKLVVGVHWYAK